MNLVLSRTVLLAIVFMALALGTIPVAAQITLQGGVGLGIGLPQGDYGGSTIDHYAGSAYGMSTGYNVHGKARVGLLGLRVAGEIGYSSFSNTGESEPGQGKMEVSHSIL
ncbi:MAG: hypothetical protein L0287_35475, partial [Anaerolineae bacterium]|nr:hypothetical protein [Anaerolineae bacterium]